MRILHIGNIANNAYMAAKILNERGIESDVLVADYYHVGSCPEWESAEIQGRLGDDFFPSWHKVNLHGFKRPKWFAQGPRYIAIHYLICRQKKRYLTAAVLWQLMWLYRIIITLKGRSIKIAFQAIPYYYARLIKQAYKRKQNTNDKMLSKFLVVGDLKTTSPSERLVSLFPENYPKIPFPDYSHSAKTNPDKEDDKDQLESRSSDKIVFEYLDQDYPILQELFKQYDMVIGYSIDGMYPLLCEVPYCAFEHGTIRSLPFEQSVIGRQTAAVYQNADAVFITNSDVRGAAEKLGLNNYHFIPHPTNELITPKQEEMAKSMREKLLEETNSDFIVFHPPRHHWDPDLRDPNWEKGNDKVINAFSDFVETENSRALLLLVEAGKMVDKSKDLIRELGIANRVLWLRMQPHQSFMRFILASDVIVDQFHKVPLSMGGIPPKAMLAGRPIISQFSEYHLGWCYPEMPPLITADYVSEITQIMTRLYNDKEYAIECGHKGKEWYETYYSNEVVFNKFSEVLRKTIR